MELTDLEGRRDPNAVVVITIAGMAGVGKTALAVHAAHRMAPDYPDGQLFLDLHGHTEGVRSVEPSDALDRLLRALGVAGGRIPPDLDDRAALYRSELAGRRMLVLLENAGSERQVLPLLPGSPGCMVLITGRRRLAGLDQTHTLLLDVLPPRDAVELFRRSVGERRLLDEPAELLDRVVEACGLLPLAIRIAAARLGAHPSWRVRDLVERLRDHQRLAELEAGHRTVLAALDLSYHQLTPDLQRVYHLCGLHPGADFDTAAIAALTHTRPPEAARLADRLIDDHLLQEPAPRRFRFHDLVRTHAMATAAREMDEADRRAALTRLFDQYCHTASVAMHLAYPYEYERRPAVPPPVLSDPHAPGDPVQAAGWLDAELANLLAVAHHAADHDSAPHLLHLSSTLDRHLRTRGRYVDAERLHSRSLDAARGAGDRRGEVAALTKRGPIRRLLGRYEQAMADFTQAVTVAREIGDRSGEMEALTGAGHVLNSTSRYGQAAERFGEALEIARGVGDKDGELEALTGLGWSRFGQGRDATEQFEHGLEIARARRHRITELHALRGLGHAYRRQGRLEEAARCYRRALGIAHEIGNPHGQLSALVALGHVHRLRARPQEAADNYRRVFALAREIDDRNYQYEALQGLGRVRCSTGDPGHALDLHRRALDLVSELGQLVDQARAHDGLAHAHHALHQDAQARRHWRQALDILVHLGVDHTEDEEAGAEAIRARLGDRVQD
ncbi:ATP-binding protein [Allonocardiopsis opalescens]|uniref:ATP-binding protein n=1 Tax=Allonocardiopsis opalescens TaxID=1144618 RepID=UPI001FE53918|nr:tetratricopeptide repeat protein [Allonocardiopsis opalescens]